MRKLIRSEIIKTLLKEARYDRIVTVLSRLIMKVLNDSIDFAYYDDEVKYFTYLFDRQYNTENIYQYVYNHDKKKIESGWYERNEYITQVLDQIENVIDKIYIDISISYRDETYFSNTGAYNKHDKILTVKLGTGLNMKRVRFDTIVAMVKDLLAHELEHSAQDAEYQNPTFYKKVGNKAKFKIETFEDFINYYSDPIEIDAYAAGFYKKAKTMKKPFSWVVDDFIINLYFEYSEKFDKKKLLFFLREVLKKEIYKMAESRFPMGIVYRPKSKKRDIVAEGRLDKSSTMFSSAQMALDSNENGIAGVFPQYDDDDDNETHYHLKKEFFKEWKKADKENLKLDRPTSHGGWSGEDKNWQGDGPVRDIIYNYLKDMGLIE